MALQIWLPLNGNLNNQGLEYKPIFQSLTTTIDNNGKIGKCYRFSQNEGNGIFMTSMFVHDFMDKYINNHSFSLCAWINTTSSLSTPIMSLTDGLRLYCGESTAILLYNNQRAISCDANTSTNDGKWHHIVGTYDINTNKICIYIDGILKNTVNYPSGYTYSSHANNIITFGRDSNNNQASDAYFFKGKMNDIRIYDHALSPKEVKELNKGLVLHYKLDNILHNKIYDSSGLGNNGTISGTLTLNDNSPRYNYSTLFNTAKISTNKDIFFDVNNKISISLWIYPISNNISILGSTQWQFQLRLNANNKLYFNQWNSSGGDSLYNTSVNNITLNTWTHICYTWDGTNMKLYINGINDSNFTYKNGNTHSTGHLLNIGGDIYNNNTGGSKYFNGSISDVRIYATILSEDDIKELYNNPANIDNMGSMLSFEFEEEELDKYQILKTGITKIDGFVEINENTKVLEDGSVFLQILHHNNPASNLFTSFNCWQNDDSNLYSSLILLKTIFNNLDEYEFLVCEKLESSSSESQIRWKQTSNPALSSTLSGYTLISGSSSQTGGLMNKGTYGAMHNGNTWWNCCGSYTKYSGGIPGFTGIIKSGYLDLYIKIPEEILKGDIDKNLKIFKKSILSNQFIEK